MRFASGIVSLLLSFLLIAVFSACDGSSEGSHKIGRLDVIYGTDQSTIPGAEFERDIRVEVRGVTDDDSSGSGGEGGSSKKKSSAEKKGRRLTRSQPPTAASARSALGSFICHSLLSWWI